MVLNAENGDIPLQGRISGGVKGINLASKDYCVGANICIDGGEVLAVTDRGYAKRVVVSNIDKMARYRKGLKLFTLGGENGKSLIYADVVSNPYTIISVDGDDNLHFRSTDLVAIETRIGKGKMVDKLKKGTVIKSVYAARV
jgi:DNA gyrase/topoisomerase IV subunit A